MKQFIEVSAVRIGTFIQDVCANVDFEVMSLPGGSLIAVLLCLYAIALSSIRRAATQNCTLRTVSQFIGDQGRHTWWQRYLECHVQWQGLPLFTGFVRRACSIL
jgi:hypothetical protein